MSWEEKIQFGIGVLLRVPPLFVMDSILNKTFLSFLELFPDDIHWLSWTFVLWLIVMTTCFLISIVIFLMKVEQITDTYMYILSALTLASIYKTQTNYPQGHTSFWYSVLVLFIQLIFARFFLALRSYGGLCKKLEEYPKYSWFIDLLSTFFLTLPSLVSHSNFSADDMFWIQIVSISFPSLHLAIDLFYVIPDGLATITSACSKAAHMVKTFGLQYFVEIQWTRLNIPTVLRLYCLLRVEYQFLEYIFIQEGKSSLFSAELHYNVTVYLLVRSCENVIAILGVTSVVSLITHYIGLLVMLFIGSENEEDRHLGTVSAVLFFILALQTGLSTLDTAKRLVRMYRNFNLLLTAILHFVHSMVNPMLMSLSTSRNPSVIKHLRALSICAFLVVFPLCLLWYLWHTYTLGTWLLAVTAFALEVIMKVMITLLIYTLFMVDARRDSVWEQLDDYVYYIKATGSTIEFFVGIFLFCNGLWIMLFEHGGSIRAIMMGIHAYFNIWQQAKEGWKVFMRRRTAVTKISLLQDATAEQLTEHNDVCAICYSELLSARITRCKHYFHGACLRKWMYVQDTCPICHKIIDATIEHAQNNAATERAQNNVPNGDVQPLVDADLHAHQE